MTTKTDKNFIYDYLIHLDSFLLHGVSEVGAPPKPAMIPVPTNKPEVSLPFKNTLSPVAFVVCGKIDSQIENVLIADEFVLFKKIVTAMGINPQDIYLACLNESSENLKQINEELSIANCHYVVCLGAEVSLQLVGAKIEAYHKEEAWQEVQLFQKNINLITIPSLAEMITDPRHKKAAWAHLKKIAEQLA